MVSEKIIDDVIADLQGTCQTLEYALNYYDVDISELSQSDFWHIDNAIFLCDVCGWWCDSGDYSENAPEGVCSQCGEDDV